MMALVDLPVKLPYPGWHHAGDAGGALSTLSTLIDGAGEYDSMMLQAPKSGNIIAFGWLPGTVVGAGTLELRAETVGTDGVPTGSLWAANTNLASIAPTSSTWRWDTLTSPAAVTAGQLIAFKLLYQSGTSVRTSVWSRLSVPHMAKPYRVAQIGAADPDPRGVICAIKYDDNTVPFCGLFPTTSTTFTVSIDESGTPDEVGAKFTLAFKCTVAGIGVRAGTAARVFDLNLYDASNNVLASLTGIDTDQQGDINQMGMYLFATPVTLDPGTYRATVSPKSGASSIVLNKIALDAAATREAWPWGLNGMWTERTNAGAWTDTDTAVPILDLFLSQIDDGAGSGGATFPILAGAGGPLS